MLSNLLGGHNGYWTTDPQVYGSAAQQARYQALIAAQQAFLGSLNPLQGATIGPPEPEPIEDAGIRAGEVRAWRIWDMDRHGFLESVSVGVTWAPGVPMEGDPDSGRYGYGVHAFKSAHEALREAEDRVFMCVVGQIDLWGTIVEHERGYRAQYGSIVSLCWMVNGGLMRGFRLRRLCRMYGVPNAPVEWRDGDG